MLPIAIIGCLLVLFIGIPILYWIVTYNTLVRRRNRCTESWSDVQTELKRRYDLIPALIKVVKGYARHERGLLERIVELREECVKATGSPHEQEGVESALVSAMGQLMVRLENYPDLKASQNYLELQKQLAETEDRIQASLRFYNANIREMNDSVLSFPSKVIASFHGFPELESFKVADREVAERMKDMPEIEL